MAGAEIQAGARITNGNGLLVEELLIKYPVLRVQGTLDLLRH